MREDAPIRIGQIGVGNYGHYRRDRLRETGLFHLAACYDRNSETRAAACREEGAEAAGSAEELIARPDLEGIVIATGLDTHADLVIQAMRAGKHVFVEKPLCASLAQVRDIQRVQKETGGCVGVGHKHIASDSTFALVQTLQAQDKLGTIACYEENTSHSGGLEIQPGQWRGSRTGNPGGMLMQCGVHALHRLTHHFGPVESLSAMMRYDAHPATETADVACVLLRHTSGMVGTLSCYHVTAYCHEFRLFGTKGNLYVDTFGKRAWYQPRHRGEIEERVELPLPALPEKAELLNLISWAEAIRGQGEPSPSLEDGVQAILPVFAAEIADEEGRRVTLAELLRETAAAR